MSLTSVYQDYKESLGPEVSVEIAALKGDQLLLREQYGPVYKYFDLASVTKIVFMVPAIFEAFDDYDQKVQTHLEWWPADTKIRDLLTHTSGLAYWRPLYEKIDIDWSLESRWRYIADVLKAEDFQASAGSVYSDLGVLGISLLLQRIHGKELHEIWLDLHNRLNYPEDMFFHVENKPRYPRSEYAPTEVCAYRKKLICGEVHDENCWALGGVTANAGLFASMEAMIDWSRSFLKVLHGSEEFYSMTRRAIPVDTGDWGLGFMKPTEGQSSCGSYYGPESFGHTGFTGTSWWHDPEQDLTVVLLTNRVLVGRENRTISQLRRAVHDEICRSL